MKKLIIVLAILLSANHAFAQLVWVGINGQTQFCPGDNRQVSYSLTGNVQVYNWRVFCKRCDIYLDGQWLREDTEIRNGAAPSSITIRWDSGNYDDAGLDYWVYGKNPYPFWNFLVRTHGHYIKLVENTSGTNVIPTYTSSVSTLTCGSTSSFTFTANWKNANSYNWEPVSGGSISGSTTGATITVIPSNGTTDVTVRVRGYNSACNVYSPWKYATVIRSAPVVNEITGPDYVCYGAPSVVSHYVNNIPGVTYEWFSTNHSSNQNIVTNSQNSPSIFVNAGGSGPFTLNVRVTGCGTFVTKTKAVNSTNSTPSPPYITSYPGTHCAGSCATYYTQIPTGYAVERQFRYNYGYWDVANSNGSIYICTQSYDTGYKPVELRSKGICGTFSSIYTQSINISYCGYMMATNEEDSLALTELKVENEISLYPNPSTTTMTISLPEEMEESQIIILSDQGEVIAIFENTKTMFTLNTGKLGRGNYYLSVAGKEKKLTKRFVVE